MKTILLLSLVMTFVYVAGAQVDPSNLSLIKGGSDQEEDPSSSDRYTVKPKKKPTTTTEGIKKTSTGGSQGVEDSPKQIHRVTTLPDAAPKEPVIEDDPDAGAMGKMRDLVLGGSPEALDEYRSYLPPDDVRRNLLEIQLSPFFVYNDSKSPYWYRNYYNFSPGISFQSDIWFTPMFGVDTSFKRTLGGDIRNSATAETYSTLAHEWLSFGLRFRRYFGFGDKAPAIIFGLDYSEYMMKLPSDDVGRSNVKVSSPKIVIEARVPKTNKQLSVYGLEVMPGLRQQESGTAINVKSGTGEESFGVGLSAGEEYKLSRSHRIFWKLSYRLYKSLYTGGANLADPLTGTTPTNVPVTNSFGFFEFGFIWGK